MNNSFFTVEPIDTLVSRDGRPFNSSGGARSRTLPFPYPSVVAGGFKWFLGMANGGGVSGFNGELVEKLNRTRLFGPLLVRKEADSFELFVPPPSDALIVRQERVSIDMNDNLELRVSKLLPSLDANYTNLGNRLSPLLLIATEEEVKGKPFRGLGFWKWNAFVEWLVRPISQNVLPGELGIGGLETDRRVHVKIDQTNRVAEEGMLYVTSGIDFGNGFGNGYQLAVKAEWDSSLEQPDDSLAPLGGERRLSYWGSSRMEFPKCPPEITKSIQTSRSCRIILLTPAYFSTGSLPMIQDATVVAMANERYQVVSGWDMQTGSPKPTRRLLPAGSVFFVELEEGIAVAEWVERMWFANLGDDTNLTNDGFGLCALGVWDKKKDIVEI